jgi:non-heme chloroperoxidase
MTSKGSPAKNADLYTDDDAVRAVATRQFVADCTEEPLSEDIAEAFVAFNDACPALVRRALFRADYDIRPVWQGFSKPFLSIHGVEDRVVLPICGIEAADLAPNSDLRLYEECGHAPFIEFPDRFNADLTQFTETTIGAAL